MIRHVFFNGLFLRVHAARATHAIILLICSMIEAASRRLLVTAVSLSALLETGKIATARRAVTLTAITVGTDEEELATRRAGAETHPKAGLVGSSCWHRASPAGGQPTPLNARIALLLVGYSRFVGVDNLRPRLRKTTGVNYLPASNTINEPK